MGGSGWIANLRVRYVYEKLCLHWTTSSFTTVKIKKATLIDFLALHFEVELKSEPSGYDDEEFEDGSLDGYMQQSGRDDRLGEAESVRPLRGFRRAFRSCKKKEEKTNGREIS